MNDVDEHGNLRFDRECPKCRGAGLASGPGGDLRSCPACSGLGVVPTNTGRRVLIMLERLYDLPLKKANRGRDVFIAELAALCRKHRLVIGVNCEELMPVLEDHSDEAEAHMLRALRYCP